MRKTERGNGTGLLWLAIPLLFILMQFTPSIQGQDPLTTTEITLTGGENSIQQLLERISLQTGYLFTYDADLISGRKRVDFRVEGIPLKKALDSLFQNPRLGYQVIDRNIVIYQKNETAPAPLIEEIDRFMVQGTIVDGQSGKPLSYATIALFGTSQGSITNQEGQFSF